MTKGKYSKVAEKGGTAKPVVVDGELEFESIKAAAGYAWHNGWAPSLESAYHRVRLAAQGADHRAYGHEFRMGKAVKR